MASNIKFKRSAVQNRVPTTAQLDLGELALNTYDGKLYTEINTGSAAVVEIGSKLSSLVVDGDNGGGGGDVVFHGTTAGRDLTWDYSNNSLEFADNVQARFGTDNDLRIYHDNSQAIIQNSTGVLRLRGNEINLHHHSSGVKFFQGTGSEAKLYYANGVRVTTTADGVDIGGVGSLKLPVGTTAQRNSSPVAGDIRYNTTTGGFEGYSSSWGELGGGGIGIGSTSTNPSSGVVANRIGVGFTDINVVGSGISVTGYGSTIVLDFNDFKPGSFNRSIHNYTATAGQTTFAGLNYNNSEKQIAVYLNGARLSEATYTATSGTTVVLDVGASVGDEVEIINIHINSDVDRKVNTYTATAGQTTFTGLSYNSSTELDVYLNGIRLASDDFTATSGNTVVLAVGASVNDTVDIVSTGDGVSFRSTADTSGDKFTLTNVGIGTDVTPDKLNVRGNVNVVGVVTASTGFRVPDGNYNTNLIGIGNHEDFIIYHDTAHTYAENKVGDFRLKADTIKITSRTGGENFIQADVNNAVRLYYDGVQKMLTSSTGINVDFRIAASGDENTYVNLGSPADTFQFYTGGVDRLFITGGPSGGGTVQIRGDNNKLQIGASQDLELFHTGTHSFIQNSVGNLLIGNNYDGDVGGDIYIQAKYGENSIICFDDGGVELFYDASKKFETISSGAKVTGNLEVTGVLTYDDVTNVDSVGIITARNGINCTTDGVGKGINIGAGQDLIIQHNGTNSFIDNNTGDLYIQTTGSGDDILIESADDFTVKVAGSETAIQATGDGAVELYFDNSKKLETTGYGINITAHSDIRFTNGNWTGDITNAKIQLHNNILYLAGGTEGIMLREGGTDRWRMDPDGNFDPATDSAYDIGQSNLRVRVGYFDDITVEDINVGDGVTIGGELNLIGSSDAAKYIDARVGTSNNLNFRSTSGGDSNHVTMMSLNTSGASIVGDLSLGDGTADSAAGPEFKLNRNSASPANADYLGQIKFAGRSSTGVERNYAKITGKILDVTNGSEDGILEFAHIKAGSQVITGRFRSDSLQLLNGTQLTVAGTTTLNSPVTVDTSTDEKLILSGSTAPYIRFQESSANKAYIQWNPNGYIELRNQEDDSTLFIKDGLCFSQSVGGTQHTIWHSGNDGSGSGLDADTLDSVQGSSFLRSDATDTASGAITFTSSHLQLSGHWYSGFHASTSNYIHFYPRNHSGNVTTTNMRAWNGSSSDVFQIVGGSATGLSWRGNTIWTAENDGSGSGLDADTLDGIQASSFLRSDTGDSLTAQLTIINDGGLNIYSSTNAVGAKIKFSDNTNAQQNGTLTYKHADGSITTTGGNSNDGWVFEGTETRTVVKVVGDIEATGNMYASSGDIVFHTGNDGSGSGLDADTLDGAQGSQFLRSDSADTCSGQITFTNQIISRKDGNKSTQGGAALVLTHATTSALRMNFFIHDDFPSGKGTGYLQVTESGVSNDRHLNLQGYGGNVMIGNANGTPTEKLDVNGTVKANAFSGNGASLTNVNATTLDSIDSSSFLRSDVNDAQALQRIEFKANDTYNYDTIADSAGNKGCIEVFNNGIGNDAFMAFHAGGDYALYFGLDADTNKLAVGGWSMGANKYAIYHEGNKPTSSDLNLLSSNSDDTATGRIIFQNNQTDNEDNMATTSSYQGGIEIKNEGVGNDAFMAFHAGSDYALYFGLDADSNRLAVGGWSMGAVKRSILHERYATIRGSSSGDGFGITLSMDGTFAPGSVGHNANSNEGIFWHNNANYGIYRTAGVWSGNYQQLRLDWPTGIIIDGGDQYGLSGVKFESHLYPDANNTRDIGSTSLRWRNIYTNDLNLSNEGGANDVDGTWGNFTIQEGEDDLFLINKRNGKKYKFNLTEV